MPFTILFPRIGGAKFAIVEPKEMKTINRRDSLRIELKLRCHVTSPALWLRSAMHTENISRNGVLVAWLGEGAPLPLPAMGQIITLEVELPANHGFGQKCIHCQGTVTRVSRGETDAPQVALRVNYMDFRSFHEKMRTIQVQQPIANSWMA
jgi:hypothetical protein